MAFDSTTQVCIQIRNYHVPNFDSRFVSHVNNLIKVHEMYDLFFSIKRDFMFHFVMGIS